MKKKSTWLGLGGLMLAVVAYVAFGAGNVPIFLDQGGAKQTIATGGEVEYQSGSTLDVQSGTTFTDASTKTISGGTSVTSKMAFNSGSELETLSGSTVDVQAGTAVAIAAGASVSAGKWIYQSGSELEALSGSTVDVQAGVAVTLAAGASVSAGKWIYQSGSEFEALSGSTVDLQDGTTLTETRYVADGQSRLKRLVRSTWDATVDGGTSVTAYDLGEDLPADAIVTQNWFQVITQITDDGSGTYALSCAGANDLFTATDISGSAGGTITSGEVTGEASTMFDVGGSACDITWTLAGDSSASAGKLVFWIEYVVTE